MNLILVAHGTRRPEGIAMIGDLAERVSAIMNHPVQVGFVDVLGPTPTEILADAAGTGEPAIVVPAFLSRGYHVRADLPVHVAASGHPDVTVTPALGPSALLARIVAHQLCESGWRRGDSIILAAAGTSDRTARADLRTAAMLLSTLTGSAVDLAFAATGKPGGDRKRGEAGRWGHLPLAGDGSPREPAVEEAVARSASGGRVAVASYLLADGLFQERLRASGADVVSAPLATHPGLATLIASRFQAARTVVAA